MIILDAGHGGRDLGGGSNQFFYEKNMNKTITDYMYNRLKELGIPVVKVRNNDETLYPKVRTDKIASLGTSANDILISNHINNGGSAGGEVIYSLRGTKELPNLIANNLKAVGLPIRNVYQRVGKTGRDFYFILRNTTPNNAMIIEYGFADNSNDTNRILYEWPTLAEAVIKALCEYLDITYVQPKNITYIVKSDDTLYTIAKKFKVSIESIKSVNNRFSDKIYPREELLIPINN